MKQSSQVLRNSVWPWMLTPPWGAKKKKNKINMICKNLTSDIIFWSIKPTLNEIHKKKIKTQWRFKTMDFKGDRIEAVVI